MFYHVSIKTFKTQTFSKIINAFFEERIMNIEKPGKYPVRVKINKIEYTKYKTEDYFFESIFYWKQYSKYYNKYLIAKVGYLFD